MYNTSESADSLCRTFAQLAMRTWHDLRDSFASGHCISEESLTDFLLLDLIRSHSHNIHVRKFTKHDEGKTTGADWEWWFAAPRQWFGMRVQAKRLDPETLRYESLSHKVRKSRQLQINLLIKDAAKRDLYPIYCFYNYFNQEHQRAPWNCRTFMRRVETLGCSVADATRVRTLLCKSQVDYEHVATISLPWMCLVCCTGHAGPSATLPERARGVAEHFLAGSRRHAPEIRAAPPPYLESVTRSGWLRVGGSLDRVDPPGDIDGILIIDEQRDSGY